MTRRLKNAVTVLLFLAMLAAFVAESFVTGHLHAAFARSAWLLFWAVVVWVWVA